MSTTTPRSESADLEYGFGLPPGVTHRLDLNDPRQRRYAASVLRGAKDSADSVAALEQPSDPSHNRQAPDPSSGLQPLNVILGFGSADGVAYTASAYSSYPGGTTKTAILLTLYAGGQTIGSQSDTQYDGGTNFLLSVTGSLPPGVEGNVVALATFYIWTGQNPIPAVYTVNVGDSVAPADACQLQPTYAQYGGTNTCVNTVPVKQPVVVCLRQYPEGCDYTESTQQPGTTGFPLQGSVTFEQPLAEPFTGSVLFALVAKSGGAATPVSVGPGSQSSYVRAAANTLHWNFPPDALPLPLNAALFDAPLEVIVFVTAAMEETKAIGTVTFTSLQEIGGNASVYVVPRVAYRQ